MTPTIVFDTYWRFAAERLAMFYRRYSDPMGPWTSDPILKRYRFTNAYRAADRVSQYLIREVQTRSDRPQTAREVFFRTMLFKIFNRIDTWEALEDKLGPLEWDRIDLWKVGRNRGDIDVWLAEQHKIEDRLQRMTLFWAVIGGVAGMVSVGQRLFLSLFRISRNSFGPFISFRLRSCRSSSVASGSPRRSSSWPAISDASAAFLARIPARGGLSGSARRFAERRHGGIGLLALQLSPSVIKGLGNYLRLLGVETASERRDRIGNIDPAPRAGAIGSEFCSRFEQGGVKNPPRNDPAQGRIKL